MAKKITHLEEDLLFEGDEWLLVTDNDNVSKKLSTGRIRDYADTVASTLSGTLVEYTDNYISTCSGSLQEQLDTKATTSYVTDSLSSKATTVSGSTINYTVGSGSQFETIKGCFDYIGSTFHAGEVDITITLATQVHRINTGPIINRDFNHKITVLCNNQEIRVTANTGSTVFNLLGSGYLKFEDAVFISESAVANSYLKLMYCYYSTVYFYDCTFTDFNWVVDGLYSTILLDGCSITTYSSGTGWTVLFVRNSSLYINNTVVDNVVPAGYSHFVWGTESSVISVGWTTVAVSNFNVGFYAEYGTQIDIGAASFTNTAVQYSPTKGVEGNTLALIVDADNTVRRITSDGLNLFDTGYTPTVPLSPVNKGYVDSEITTLSGYLGDQLLSLSTTVSGMAGGGGREIVTDDYVSKTVGSSGDFATISEAVEWVKGIDYRPSNSVGWIELGLLAGTHSITEPVYITPPSNATWFEIIGSGPTTIIESAAPIEIYGPTGVYVGFWNCTINAIGTVSNCFTSFNVSLYLGSLTVTGFSQYLADIHNVIETDIYGITSSGNKYGIRFNGCKNIKVSELTDNGNSAANSAGLTFNGSCDGAVTNTSLYNHVYPVHISGSSYIRTTNLSITGNTNSVIATEMGQLITSGEVSPFALESYVVSEIATLSGTLMNYINSLH